MTSEQFFGLYNYWVVVFLMMTGFYIVIARGNLVKSVIGLNIFQTSVFLLYISMGKINGATAPIVPPSLAGGHDAHAAAEHDGELHGGDPTEPTGGEEHAEPTGGGEHAEPTGGGEHAAADGHVEHKHVDHETAAHEAAAHEVGHAMATGKPNHTTVSPEVADEFAGTTLEPMMRSGEVVYSNPLPSVLMLTAIVVGIATTALALALIVRIREDYGTIEEDEILQLDRSS